MAKDLIVQDNTLINSSYSPSLTEQRMILMCVAMAQKKSKIINEFESIDIHVAEFAEMFKVDKKSSYRDVKNACNSILNRQFSYKYINKKGLISVRKTNWLQHYDYIESEGLVRLRFTTSIIPFISDLNKAFTKYYLQDVAEMTSVYAIRLYELVIAWRETIKTYSISIEDLRLKLGIEPDEYIRMFNFKKRVLDIAVDQINKHSNIKVHVEQEKRGRKISGFTFTFVEFSPERDSNTIDWIDEDKKPARKKITKQQAESMAKVGESWQELLIRIGKNFHVIGI